MTTTLSLRDKVRNKELRTIPVSVLRPNPKNPPERTMDNAGFKTLLREVKRFGVVEPIGVHKRTSMVINGHRRWMAAKAAGLSNIDAFVYDITDEEMDELFLALNTTGRKFTSGEELFTHLNGGKITKKTMNAIDHIVKLSLFGKRTRDHHLQIIRAGRKSPVTYRSAIQMFTKLTEEIRKGSLLKWQFLCLEWITKVSGPYKMNNFCDDNIDAEVLLDAVKQQKPIKRSWSV
tara:strand:+ start:43 stop:741 length:699 start_codon:yes stop_codon:yes gene_type:complete